MKTKRRKLLSMVSAMAILFVSLLAVIPMSAMAETQPSAAEEIPLLTDVEGFNVWTNPASYNYTITENPWKLVRGAKDNMPELRYDTNRYGDKQPISIDLNKTPYLLFDIEATGEFEIKVAVVGVGDIDMFVGSGKALIDLSKNEKITAVADHGVIQINTLKFEFVDAKEGSSITVNALKAIPKPVEIPLLTDVEGFNVWTNPASYNYTITENPWKLVRGAKDNMPELRYDTNRYGDKQPISVDLNKTPYLYFDIEASGKFEIKVAVVGVGDIDMFVGSGKALIDLSKDNKITAVAEHGVIQINTLKFEFVDAKEGSHITVHHLAAMGAGSSANNEKDAEIAAAVDKQITDLGPANELTLDKKADVEAVRAAYEALTMDQTKLVTKLADLEAAEKAIEKLVYEDALDLKDNKTIVNDKTGIKMEGTLPANGVLVVEDKADSGLKGSAEIFVEKQELKNLLGCYGIALKVGEDQVDRLDRKVKLSFPIKGGAETEKYAVLYYDPLDDVFTVIPCVVDNGFAVAEVNTNKLGDYVLVGNDAAKDAQDNNHSTPNTPDNSNTPDTPKVPETGSHLPVAAMVLAAVSAGYVISRKRK